MTSNARSSKATPATRAAKKTVPVRKPRPRKPVPAEWDPEPIYHSLVRELHFDPKVVLV